MVLELLICFHCWLATSNETRITTTTLYNKIPTTTEYLETGNTDGAEVPNSNKSMPSTALIQTDNLWIIHQGFVSEKEYTLFTFILNAILKPTICILGLIGNSLGISVLFHRELRRSTYWYLCGLTISDTLYLFCSLIMALPAMLSEMKPKLSEYIQAHSFPYVNAYLALVFSKTSAWLTVIFSLERYIAVRKPLLIRRSFIDRHAVHLCIVTYVLAFVAYAPALTMFETKVFYDSQKNDTTYKFGYREWSEASRFRVVYGMVGAVIGMYLPMFLVVFINIGTVIQIKIVQKHRIEYLRARDYLQSVKEQKKLNITLAFIAVSYIVSVAPRAVIITISKFDDAYTTLGQEHFLLYVIIDFSTFCLALSSAMDFVVYYLVSDVIRRHFKRQCGCLTRRGKMSDSSTGRSGDLSEPYPPVNTPTFSSVYM